MTFIALEKCNKECQIIEIILVQGFCPLKIKISQFPNGFRLINYMKYFEQTFCLYGAIIQ